MRRNTALFVAISLLSGFGGGVLSLVAGIWILDLTGSTGTAALAGLCVYAPQLAGPWLGATLDRIPRRGLVIAANLVRAGCVLGLLAVRAAGDSWLIFAVTLVHGVGYVLEDAGETALLPATLPADRLATVNGWRSSALEGTKLVAPAAGAGLYAWRGGHAVATLVASLALVSPVLYAALRLVRSPSTAPPPARRALRTALAVLGGRHELRATVGLATVAIAMSGFQIAAIYAFVTRELDLPATFLGVVLSAQGGGSILGGLVAGRLIRLRGPVTVSCAGATLFAAGCLIRCLPWWPAMLGAAIVSGIGLPWTLVAALTAIQAHTPPALLGRVAGTANTVMFGPIALAIPLGSATAHLDSRVPLVTAAAACLAATAVCRTPSAAR